LKIFIANLTTETNTFSPIPTGWPEFERGGIYHGDGSLRTAESSVGHILAAWRRLAERDTYTVWESLAAHAQPGGRTAQVVYQALKDEILEDLRRAGPVDIVLLALHGAMAAEHVDDCEGDLLTEVRAIVGREVVVGAVLDLHCHATRAMFDAADLVVAYKEYPHTDYIERAEDLYRLAIANKRGEIRPTLAVHDLNMIGVWHTTREPMQSFVEHMKALEGKAGILQVSFGHGFPWADVKDVGAKIWVYADDNFVAADNLAGRLGRRVWDMRRQTAPSYLGVDEAISRAVEGPHPAVLADVADNPGGGAPGDSTFILQALIDRGVKGCVAGCYWAPEAMDLAEAAGVGERIDLFLGGAFAPVSGAPVRLSALVCKVRSDQIQSGLGGRWISMGRTAWLSIDGIDIVVSDRRFQTISPDVFTGLGISLFDKVAIVVKSTQHFQAEFASITKNTIYVETAGAISPRFAEIPYTKRALDYWPRVDRP